MEASLDELVYRLLDDVALCGERGRFDSCSLPACCSKCGMSNHADGKIIELTRSECGSRMILPS